MEEVTIIAAIIGAVAILVNGMLGVWTTIPRPHKPAAYEMAYRGKLRELAGRRNKSKRLLKEGRAWLRTASYQHRRSANAGSNDAMDDIKSVVISSVAIDGGFRCDEQYLRQQISERIHSRLGNRPTAQSLEVARDAIEAVAFYQEVIPSQMRRLVVSQIVGVTALVVAVVLTLMAPVTWPAISAVPHEVIDPTSQLLLKVTYAAVIVGFLSSGIGILFVSR